MCKLRSSARFRPQEPFLDSFFLFDHGWLHTLSSLGAFLARWPRICLSVSVDDGLCAP